MGPFRLLDADLKVSTFTFCLSGRADPSGGARLVCVARSFMRFYVWPQTKSQCIPFPIRLLPVTRVSIAS